jgi:hypothetical protein
MARHWRHVCSCGRHAGDSIIDAPHRQKKLQSGAPVWSTYPLRIPIVERLPRDVRIDVLVVARWIADPQPLCGSDTVKDTLAQRHSRFRDR